MNKNIASTFLALALVAASGAQSYRDRYSRENDLTRRAREMMREHLKERLGIERQGQEAERRGDFKEAELCYLCAHDFSPVDPTPHLLLARLYDRQGREKEARLTYKEFLRPRDDAGSSDQDNPWILVRFGDLSLKHGFPRDAAEAYAHAASRGPDPKFYPRLLTDDRSMDVLRAGAHAAASWKYAEGSATKEALAEAKVAAASAPKWWAVHYYLGRAYKMASRPKEASKELKIAEASAPKEGLEMTKELRG